MAFFRLWIGLGWGLVPWGRSEAECNILTKAARMRPFCEENSSVRQIDKADLAERSDDVHEV
ncbi:hypothetical protein DYH55_13590 [Methylovirgula sp. 4M-Z18]|nr:hypothetical protein DYH55_13590 [Methylovirgula sp. 4M-Z18]